MPNAAWFVSAVAVCGCAAPRDAAPEPTADATTAQPAPAPAPAVRVTTFVAGASVEGRPIRATVLGEERDEVVLFVGAIHGDETAGALLLERLIAHLRGAPDALGRHTAVVVPVANPDGLARNTRTNARGIDLNRNFPAPNFAAAPKHGVAPLSEPETMALFSVLQMASLSATRVVSIHQMSPAPEGVAGPNPPLLDHDGPAADLALAMSWSGRAGVRKLGGEPGSLGSYAASLGTPLVTLELARGDEALGADELWRRHGDMLLTAIRYGD